MDKVKVTITDADGLVLDTFEIVSNDAWQDGDSSDDTDDVARRIKQLLGDK